MRIRSHGHHCSRKVPTWGHMGSNIASRRYVDAMVRQNVRLAKRSAAGQLLATALCGLRNLTVNFGFSIALGDLRYLDGGWYVTHAGLLRLASHNHCSGIRVQPVCEFCDPAANRWVFKATVSKSPQARGLGGLGGGCPPNRSPLCRGREVRGGGTRAGNRALRQAYGIG